MFKCSGSWCSWCIYVLILMNEFIRGEARYKCPHSKGYHDPLNLGCYKVQNELQEWESSDRACINQGARLVSITSKSVNVYFTEALDRYLPKGYDEAWIGLDIHINSGNLTWPNGDPVDYTSWEQNEPRNKSGCVSLSRDNLWRVRDCNSTLPSICQFYPNGPPTIAPQFTHGNCPITYGAKNWTKVGTKCYYVESEWHWDWYDALLNCGFNGGKLLSIHNKEQQHDVTTLLQNNNVTAAWIGLTYHSTLDYGWTDYSAIDYLNIESNSTHINGSFTVYYINSTDGKWYPSSRNIKLGTYVCWAYLGHYLPTTRRPPGTTINWGTSTVPDISIPNDYSRLYIILSSVFIGVVLIIVITAVIIFLTIRRSRKSGRRTGNHPA